MLFCQIKIPKLWLYYKFLLSIGQWLGKCKAVCYLNIHKYVFILVKMGYKNDLRRPDIYLTQMTVWCIKFETAIHVQKKTTSKLC